MDRPRVVVGFCRDWIEYADHLEAERDKLLATIAEQIVETVEQEAEIFRLATIVQELAE
jgi:hypothetical protein